MNIISKLNSIFSFKEKKVEGAESLDGILVCLFRWL